MTRFLAVGAIIALSVSAAPASADPVTFRDPEGVFTVELPRAPTVASDSTVVKTGDKVPLTEYVVDDGNTALEIMIADYSKANVEISLEGAVQGMVNGGRTLTSNKPITLDGHNGRFALLTDQDGNQLGDQVFVVGRRLYQAMSVLPKNPTDAQRAEVAHYNETFHFTQK